MSQFDVLIPYILQHEGVSPTNPTGYANIDGDSGKVTNWGISQTAWSLTKPKYAQFVAFPPSVVDLTKEQALAIYQIVYYLPLFDSLPPGLALICFDHQVNTDEGGVKPLQRALNVTPDGDFGPVSQAALRLALRDVPQLIEDVSWQRLWHYIKLGQAGITPSVFLAKFWAPRTLNCRKEALSL